MRTQTVFAAFAALQLLVAVPAMAEVEGNGPGGTGGSFEGWSVPANMPTALAANFGSEGYTPSPCYSEALSGSKVADVGSDPSRFSWPAMPLGGSGAVYARASGPRAPGG